MRSFSKISPPFTAFKHHKVVAALSSFTKLSPHYQTSQSCRGRTGFFYSRYFDDWIHNLSPIPNNPKPRTWIQINPKWLKATNNKCVTMV